MAKKYGFVEIFREYPDGSFSPQRYILVNGTLVGPDARMQPGSLFGGVDFHLFKYLDVAAEELPDGVLKLIGFYKPYALPKELAK